MIREWKRLYIGEGKVLKIKCETKITGGQSMVGGGKRFKRGDRLETEEIYV